MDSSRGDRLNSSLGFHRLRFDHLRGHSVTSVRLRARDPLTPLHANKCSLSSSFRRSLSLGKPPRERFSLDFPLYTITLRIPFPSALVPPVLGLLATRSSADGSAHRSGSKARLATLCRHRNCGTRNLCRSRPPHSQWYPPARLLLRIESWLSGHCRNRVALSKPN